MNTPKRKNKFWDGLEVEDNILEGLVEELKPASSIIINTLLEHADGLTEGQLRKMCTGTTWLQHKALKGLLVSDKVRRGGKGVKANPFIYKVKK